MWEYYKWLAPIKGIGVSRSETCLGFYSDDVEFEVAKRYIRIFIPGNDGFAKEHAFTNLPATVEESKEWLRANWPEDNLPELLKP
jgi:hypothetical protein